MTLATYPEILRHLRETGTKVCMYITILDSCEPIQKQVAIQAVMSLRGQQKSNGFHVATCIPMNAWGDDLHVSRHGNTIYIQ